MDMKNDSFKNLMNETYADAYVEIFDTLPKRAKEIIVGLIIQDGTEAVEIFEDLLMGNYGSCICNSPIETIFYISYMYMVLKLGFPYSELISLDRQYEIKVGDKKYYADFIIDTEMVWGIVKKSPLKLVIECDGHEFHEKTKRQVEMRNSRDFDLKKCGYEVLHFSGSQIFNDPIKCAKDVFDYAVSVVGEAYIDDSIFLDSGG